MEQSPRLSLSYVQPAQAQKHVTVNETFRRLDALTQLTVLSQTIAAEPGAPAEGDAYILPASPTGSAWVGFSTGNIATFQDGAWVEITALEGFRAWVSDGNQLVAFDGTNWAQVSGGSAETALKFGVNTTADATNRLNVKSDAVLFSYDDVTPGNDDCIVKVNKKAIGDTASHIFQTGFSGRAEFGLTGDDDFHLKVSPNGSSWADAMFIDKDDGHVGFNTTAPKANFEINIPGQTIDTSLTNSDHVLMAQESTQLSFAGIVCGNSSGNRFLFKGVRAGGTLGTPTAPDDNDIVVSMLGAIYDGSVQKNSAGVEFKVDGAVSSGVAPQRIEFRTGTASRSERMRISSAGDVGIGETNPSAKLHVDGGGILCGNPTGGDKGTGNINAEGVYDDNSLLTCYVFDQALDGVIQNKKWDDKVPDRIHRAEFDFTEDPETGKVNKIETSPLRKEERTHEPMRKFRTRIGSEHDPLTLDGYAKHWQEKRHLTSLPNEASYDPEVGMSAGEWIQRLVETVEIQAVLIEELNQGLKARPEGRMNSQRA